MPDERSATRTAVRVAAGVAAFVALTLVVSEAAFWLGHRTGPRDAPDGPCDVLVLGYPSRPDGGPHFVQRLRVAAGVRAWRDFGCTHLVVSGGAVANAHVEAEGMARLAEDLGVPADRIVRERLAGSTWQNVGCALDRIDPAAAVVIASDALHVHRARRYLCRQQPGRCDEAVVASAYQPFTLPWWKVPAALHELRAAVRDRLVYERGVAASAAPCPADEASPPA